MTTDSNNPEATEPTNPDTGFMQSVDAMAHRGTGNTEVRAPTPSELEAAGMGAEAAVLSAARSSSRPEVRVLLEQLEGAHVDTSSAGYRMALEDLRGMLERADIKPPTRVPQATGDTRAIVGKLGPVQRADVGNLPAPFVAGAGVQVQHLGPVSRQMNAAGITVQHIGGARAAGPSTVQIALAACQALLADAAVSPALKSVADSLCEAAEAELGRQE